MDHPGLSSEDVAEIREAFSLFDTGGTGKIDLSELNLAIQSLGFDAKNQSIYDIILEVGKESGEIDFEEFLGMMTSKFSSERGSREEIQKIFNLFDDDQSGKITLKNMKRVATELGETMSEAELLEMIERADTNEDGEIGFEEFYALMKS